MKTAYIAGPMLGIPQLNFPAFDTAKALGLSLGWTIISPADLYRAAGFDGASYPDGNADFTMDALRQTVSIDTQQLLGLKAEAGDALAILPGWDTSIIALSCVAVAQRLMLPILDATTFNGLKESTVFRQIYGGL